MDYPKFMSAKSINFKVPLVRRLASVEYRRQSFDESIDSMDNIEEEIKSKEERAPLSERGVESQKDEE
jgi:hypothetical protein